MSIKVYPEFKILSKILVEDRELRRVGAVVEQREIRAEIADFFEQNFKKEDGSFKVERSDIDDYKKIAKDTLALVSGEMSRWHSRKVAAKERDGVVTRIIKEALISGILHEAIASSGSHPVLALDPEFKSVRNYVQKCVDYHLEAIGAIQYDAPGKLLKLQKLHENLEENLLERRRSLQNETYDFRSGEIMYRTDSLAFMVGHFYGCTSAVKALAAAQIV